MWLDGPREKSSGRPNPCGEIVLTPQGQCQIGNWHKWLDNWPELKKIQEDWFEAYPPTKDRFYERPQNEVPRHF